MRHLLELKRPTQVRPLGKQRHHTAVVGLETLPQHEDGEQLGLRKILAGIATGISGQTSRAFVGDAVF